MGNTYLQLALVWSSACAAVLVQTMIFVVVELLEVVEEEGVGLHQLHLVEEGLEELKLHWIEELMKMDDQLEGVEAQ